jgi:hypothetical protein
VAIGSSIKGFDKVLINLNKEIKNIEGRTMQGLIGAAAYIRADMDHITPTIPVDTGNLRASWFVTPYQTPRVKGVIIGFSANYAVFVHEMLGAVNWNREGSGPKFLEAAIKRNAVIILGIIQATAKIK